MRGPFFPGWIVRTIVTVALVILLLCRTVLPVENLGFPANDQAFVNILAMICAAIISLNLWIWFSFFSGFSPGMKRFVLIGGIVLVVGFFALFRMKEVSGAMVLSFEPRWWTVADRRLGKVVSEPQTESIDLATPDAAAFAQFLGPNRRCWVPDPGLARDWETQPPKLLWKQPIGAGWSAFAASNGYAVTMEQRGDEEWTSCYRVRDGKPLWGHAITARHENAMGGIGPRATPTIAGGCVYSVGATGVVQCLDARGQPLWQVDLFQRYGLSQQVAEVEVMWGRAGSPLIVDDLVVVPAGGQTDPTNKVKPKSLIALNAATGKVVWEAGDDQISYASPILTTLAGKRQIVIVSEKTVSGHDPATGRQLWNHPWLGDSSTSATSSQAVPIGSDRLLLTKGYGGGSELIELTRQSDESFQVRGVWNKPRNLQTKFTNVTIIGDHVFGLSDGILECVELETGERQWKDRRGDFGHGQILGVGKLILVQAEDGRVVLIEANPEELVELTSFQALEGKTWNNPCLYGKLLLVRNSEQAACYELP